MTNYDILKEYEAHGVPVPSYDEIIKMEEEKRWYAENLHAATDKIKELKELLKEVYVVINEGSYFDQCDILKKIDEALK